MLRGKEAHLVAELKSGTNVTFRWDFGDRSQDSNITTTSHHVLHTFTK